MSDPKPATGDNPDVKTEICWMRFAGMLESGDPHSSQTVDEVVYGNQE
jgi:hypothetical protein